MNEMVERVARALHAMHGTKSPFKPYADLYRDQARTAIEAMREPTDEMLEALNNCGGDTDAIWTAMIDAALGKVDA